MARRKRSSDSFTFFPPGNGGKDQVPASGTYKKYKTTYNKPNEHMRLKPKPAKKPNEHMRLKPKTGQAMYPSHAASASNARQWRALQKHLSEAALQAYKDRMR
jgi:hypothetical protein|tara:strand:- start:113 stop:421 length:309 start_codon:yes stop_codon:yes gene_type:complete